jgi:c-di-GMP-binding flagellar brake protein YcgR
VPDGAYVADVEVTGWSPSRRVLTVVHRGTLEFVQRRAVFRVPVAVPVELLVERDGDLVAAEGSTIEMSTAGFSVPLTRDLRPGEQASAVLRLPGEPVMAVVRVVMPGATAKLPTRVRIDEIERTDLARLTTFLRRAEVRRVRTGPAR